MRHRMAFTLIELLIVVAIIGVLAAVLVPNLLAARSRAFDAAAQNCLRQVAISQEAARTDSPFRYDDELEPLTLETCADVEFITIEVNDTSYLYVAGHEAGLNVYTVEAGAAVRRLAD